MESFSQALELVKSKLTAWGDSVILTLPNIILVLISFFLGIWIIRRARKRIKKVSSKITTNIALAQLLYNVIIAVLYLSLVIIILSILGLSKSVTTILASAGVMGLAVGLALQDPLMNLFSGIIMSVKTSFQIGDFVETNGHVGAVQAITLRSTQIRTLTGEEVSIPNKLVLQNPVKNYTTNGIRRVDIVCGVSYGSSLRKVKEVAKAAVIDLAFKDVERPVEFIFTGFGDSAINFQLRFWTDPANVWEYLDTKSEGIMRLKEAFDAENIGIPFPIRTLDIDFKGKEALAEILK
jgi:small conductance mechanosensitive channel